MMNLLTFDSLIRTFDIDADELRDLLLQVRGFYRGDQATGQQAAFLDDLAIDARG